jgi:hypothetical protein
VGGGQLPGASGVVLTEGRDARRATIFWEEIEETRGRLLKSTTPVLQCSHARSASTVVTRPWWAATHALPALARSLYSIIFEKLARH